MARGGNAVRVRIEAETSGLRAGVDQAAGTLKDFQLGSQRAASGARIFSEAITGITGAAGGATGAVATLLSGFAFGGAAGLAIAGVHTLVTAIGDIREESAKAAKEAAEHAEKIGKKMGEAALAVRRARFVAAGGNAADFDKAAAAVTSEAEATAELARRTAEHAEALAKVNAQRALLADPRMASPYAQGVKAAAERDLAAFEAAEQEKAKAVARVEKWIADIRKDVSLQFDQTTAKEVETVRKAEDAKAKERARATAERLQREIDQENRAFEIWWEGEERKEKAADEARQREIDQENRAFEIYADGVMRRAAEAEKIRKAEAAAYAEWGQKIGDTFGAVFSGAQTPAEAFKAVLADISGAIIDMAIKSIQAHALGAAAGAAESVAPTPLVGPLLAVGAAAATKGLVMALLSELPARRYGGDVLAGMPYLVGEAGPEVMVPGRSGTIVPNNQLGGGGGGIVVNVGGIIDGRNFEQVLTASDGPVARAERKRLRRRRR